MRSDSKYDSFIRAGMNPSPLHFIHKYISRFIGEDGFAIKEFSGRSCYFVVDKGEVVTSWDKSELKDKFPDKTPRKFTMIPSSLEDNKKMLEKNKDYRENLEANDPANAAMLLAGNWKYTPAANGVWERTTIEGQIVSHLPIGCTKVRAWDKAASKPAKEGGDSKSLNPDYTASIGMAKDRDGNIYIFGDYIRDLEGKQRARFREKPGVRDNYILSQAKHDGTDVVQIFPRDNGQGGVFEYKESAKFIMNEGYTVRQDPSISNASKAKRFDPFAAACYNGLVYWVKESFDKDVWDYMLLELENFNPLVKNNGFKDDLVDCFSSAFAYISSKRVAKPFSLPDMSNQHTMLYRHKHGR